MCYVYIMTNKNNAVLYTGQTYDLKCRVYEHTMKAVDGFTKRYNINKLVYYEACEGKDQALYREKQIKSWSRRKKMELVDSMNPQWRDLYNTL
jgi:putative endonuclease